MIFQLFATAIIVSIAGLFGFWAQDRSPPTRQLTEAIEDSTVHAGEIFRVNYTVYREQSCTVHLEQYVFDSRKTRWPINDDDFVSAPGPLGEEEFSIAVHVDPRAAPGPARYRAIRSYYCNPLQWMLHWPVVVISPDLPFEILPSLPASALPLGSSSTPSVIVPPASPP